MLGMKRKGGSRILGFATSGNCDRHSSGDPTKEEGGKGAVGNTTNYQVIEPHKKKPRRHVPEHNEPSQRSNTVRLRSPRGHRWHQLFREMEARIRGTNSSVPTTTQDHTTFLSNSLPDCSMFDLLFDCGVDEIPFLLFHLRSTLLTATHYSIQLQNLKICDTMEHNRSSVSIQLEAARVLQHLVSMEESTILHGLGKGRGSTQHHLADSSIGSSDRGRRIIIQSMDCHPTNAALQCIGLDLLLRSKRKKVSNKACVPCKSRIQAYWIGDGSCATIITAIKNFPTIRDIQQIGMSLISWLVEDLYCRQVIIGEGGVEWILTALTNYADDALLLCNAAAALCWLLYAGGVAGSPSAARPRQQREGLEVARVHNPTILAALDAHLENAATFGNCICLLSCLLQEDIPNEIKAFDVVILGMKRHEGLANVQESCLRFFRFRDARRYQDEFIRCIPCIIMAMHKHRNNIHIQGYACDILANLSDEPNFVTSLMQHGAVDAILGALDLVRRKQQRHYLLGNSNQQQPPQQHQHDDYQQQQADSRVQNGAIWSLAKMAIDVSNRAPKATLAFKGGIDVVEFIGGRWNANRIT